MKQFINFLTLGLASSLLLVPDADAIEHYYAYNKNHQGYSITEGHPDPATGENVIVVAGSACLAPTDCKIFVQATNRNTGAVIWQREFDYNISEAERCFKIKKSQGGYILTGYVDDGPMSHRTFVMELDPFGSVNWSRLYYNSNSVGLDIIECSDLTGYVVAGYLMDMHGQNYNTGYIMKIDPAGNILWDVTYNSLKGPSGTDYDMAESVLEVPGNAVPNSMTNKCYYVTGSVNFAQPDPGKEQKVLSVMIDDNGTVLWQQSFASGNLGAYEVGASSLYEPDLTLIYLVSNAYDVHGFFISKIDPSNGNIIQHKYYTETILDTICKMAAYQIWDKNSDSVTVTGFVHDFDWKNQSQNHNPIFAMDIDKNTLFPEDSFDLFFIPSNNHNAYFLDWLGTPQHNFGLGIPLAGKGIPRIHTPNMSYKETDDDIWFVGYKQGADGGTNYDLALLHLNYYDYAGACDPRNFTTIHGDYQFSNIALTYGSQMWDSLVNMSEYEPGYNKYTCDGVVQPPANKSTNINTTHQDNDALVVYPIPADNTLYVELPGQTIRYITVYDVSGKQMEVARNNYNQVDIKQLPPGFYILKIVVEGHQVYTRHFIKQ